MWLPATKNKQCLFISASVESAIGLSEQAAQLELVYGLAPASLEAGKGRQAYRLDDTI